MNENNIYDMDAEYGIDSRYKSNNERVLDATTLMEARLKRMKKLSKEEITKARLLQLKLQMEKYIKNPVCDNNNYFANFLKHYIDSIYSKRNTFANDIDITSVNLSQVINRHREPKEEFFIKLMIHSEKVYKGICKFNNKTWYQVYFQEKICDLISKQEKFKPEIEKNVHISEFNSVI